MNELADAFEGAVGLIVGGIILLVFASAVGQTGVLNLIIWGQVAIVIGVVVLLVLMISSVSELFRRLT